MIDAYQPNTTWLTPNRRLSVMLFKQHQQHQIQQQYVCWPSLDILPFTSWVQRLWNDWATTQYKKIPVVLTPHQENIIWLNLLKNAPESQYLLQITHTATLAKSAWGLLKQWRVDIHNPLLTLTEDGRSLQTWANQFDALCKKNGWVDSQSLPDLVAEKMKKKNIIPPSFITLVGFTELSPQYQHLLSVCESMGAHIQHKNATTVASSIKKISVIDDETEIRTMARWAKAIYMQASEKKPFLIGCVIPQLEVVRDVVLHIFSEVFSEKNILHTDTTLMPFNISAGQRLTTFPCIYAAFQLLQLHHGHSDLETMSSILRSPFLGEAEKEQLHRANFDNRLRATNNNLMTLTQLIQAGHRNSLYHHCPALAKRIKTYWDYMVKLEKKAPPSQWTKQFLTMLNILGWPGERSLNSAEYQTVQRWLVLLEEWANLDYCVDIIDFDTAIEYLMQTTKNIIFQPQTPEAAIQILGVLEASELPFEYLWVSQLEDSQWPALPKPNPFIPQRMQKTLQMPHATPERELLYYKKLTEQLTCSGKNVIFSYPLQRGDTELRPSALIHSIEEINMNNLPQSEYISFSEMIFAQQKFDYFEDKKAPPISDNEKIHGGTSMLKLQAACPFKAFAELRLHAKQSDPVTLGIKVQDRGSLIHKAMEFIWKEIKDSASLKKLSSTELNEIIHMCAENAIKSQQSNRMNQQRYVDLELIRLKNLLHRWMELELTRPSFKVIFTEYEQQITMGNMPITVRIDRIDELSNGQRVIIDYKTGKNNEIKNWFGHRPEEPQLPLYCVSMPEAISSISYAQIHPDEISFKGISQDDIGIQSIKTLSQVPYTIATTWTEQMTEWRRTLHNIIEAFAQGIADVDPKNPDEMCRLCYLTSFCRIHEKI